jgi:uncharacterized protein YkwD
MRWIRAVVILFSFAMLIGAGTYIFCHSILPGLGYNAKSAQLIIPLTGCRVEEIKPFEADLLQLINTERSRQGLPDLSLDPRLYQAAETHSWDMGCNQFFSHTDLNGQSMYDRIKAQGYIYSAAAEVIYAGSGNKNVPEEALKAWLNNTGHKAHLLNPTYSHVGIGAVHSQGGSYNGYFTVVFASPAH